MLFCRNYELNGKCFCGLWSDLLYRQLYFKPNDHQLCLRHQDWKTVEPLHSVHQSIRRQLDGGLQPQRKSTLRLGQQAFGHLSHLVWGTLGWLPDQLVMGLKKNANWGRFDINIKTMIKRGSSEQAREFYYFIDSRNKQMRWHWINHWTSLYDALILKTLLLILFLVINYAMI